MIYLGPNTTVEDILNGTAADSAVFSMATYVHHAIASDAFAPAAKSQHTRPLQLARHSPRAPAM
jgi:hypothetical protein